MMFEQVARIQTSLSMARSQQVKLNQLDKCSLTRVKLRSQDRKKIQVDLDPFPQLVASALSHLAAQLAPLLDPEAPRQRWKFYLPFCLHVEHRLVVVSLLLIACRHIDQLQVNRFS